MQNNTTIQGTHTKLTGIKVQFKQDIPDYIIRMLHGTPAYFVPVYWDQVGEYIILKNTEYNPELIESVGTYETINSVSLDKYRRVRDERIAGYKIYPILIPLSCINEEVCEQLYFIRFGHRWVDYITTFDPDNSEEYKCKESWWDALGSGTMEGEETAHNVLFDYAQMAAFLVAMGYDVFGLIEKQQALDTNTYGSGNL